MDKYEHLLSKSQGVKDCVKWIIKKIKEEQKYLEREKEEYKHMKWFNDCSESYYEQVLKREARIESMIEVKINLEKYYKKLKHEHDDMFK